MATMTRMQPVFFKSGLNQSPAMYGGFPGTVITEQPEFKETASQTWGVADLIYLDSNGTLAICTNSGNKLNSAIAGQALKAASGTTGAYVHFRAIRPDDIYCMNVYHSTAGNAVTALTQVGAQYGIILNSSKWHVDIENTTIEDGTTALGRVSVVGFPTYSPDGLRCTVGDTYGFVLVKFLPFSIATDGSPFTRILQLT